MILKSLKINSVSEGLVTNTYVICDEDTKETIVIDPGGEPEKIIQVIENLNGNLKYIFLTHCHLDHIGGIKELKENKGGIILVSRADSIGLYDEKINLAYYLDLEVPTLEDNSRLDDGDLIHIGNNEFKVILTPGHTEGGLCLYNEKENMIFTGDTLFSGTWGRTDLPTGDFNKIINSITERLMVLPDETIVYPGHGDITMIKDEKNIYLELKPKDF